MSFKTGEKLLHVEASFCEKYLAHSYIHKLVKSK